MPDTAIALRPDDAARLGACIYPAPAEMTAADLARATDDLAFVQSVKRALEAAKAKTLRPVRDRLDELRRAYDGLIDRVAEAEIRAKQAILEWRAYREAENMRAAQDAARAQAELAAAEARADAQAAGLSPAIAERVAIDVGRAVEADVTASVGPAPVPRAVAGEVGTASVTRTWTFEIINEAAIPRKYLAVDLVKLGKVVRAGVRAIPGVRIYERETIVGRRR